MQILHEEVIVWILHRPDKMSDSNDTIPFNCYFKRWVFTKMLLAK